MYIMDLGENTDPARMFECKQTWGIDSTTAADVVSGRGILLALSPMICSIFLLTVLHCSWDIQHEFRREDTGVEAG